MSTPPPFDRTSCACHNCVRCCHVQPGPLAPGDLERIAEHLGETPEEAKRHFCASPGGLWKSSSTGVTERVGTITPKRRHGRCVFLDENDRCRVHPVAPAGCAYFDTHMGTTEAHRRSVWLMSQQSRDSDYQALRNELPYAQSYKPKRY
jgi:Fe-S-cluster containining protein